MKRQRMFDVFDEIKLSMYECAFSVQLLKERKLCEFLNV